MSTVTTSTCSNPVPPPPLGPLSAFVGTWSGPGFNTIFRPNGGTTPTVLPNPLNPPPPQPPNDNILQLSITSETLTFSPSLGTVPNRAMLPGQGDIFLNGVPYTQSVNDVTNGSPGCGIHFEPGLWVVVPSTTNPAEPATVMRMGSIPHGTTILAQGTASTFAGPPQFAPVDITPILISNSSRVWFPSQDANNNSTARLPQTLPPSITQAMLDNPNSVLANAIAGQNIISTTTLSISTALPPLPPPTPPAPFPTEPSFGGGTNNMGFLLGNAAATTQNAQATQMTAIFWIETVRNPDGSTFTQIQYTQTVMLVFNGLIWPHVSVATLTSTA